MNKVLTLLIVFFVNPTFANKLFTDLVDFQPPSAAIQKTLPESATPPVPNIVAPTVPITNSDSENDIENAIPNNDNTPDNADTTHDPDPEADEPSTDVGISPTQGS